MPTVYQAISPQAAKFAATLAPEIVLAQGTNFPVMGLAFDASADEFAYWRWRAIQYGSGNLALDIDWYAATGSSGTVIWDAAISAITPNVDTQDVETDTFAAISSVTDTHIGTTAKQLHRATIAISNLDSLALDDSVMLRLSRDAGDSMAGDAIVVGVTLSYSDS